ncbi:MAG TPA: nucleoside-diphosphate kinase [Candidatus Kryptonia bacterium]
MSRTLAILKPDCVKKNLIGEVIARIQRANFKIVALKMVRLTKENAGGFYAVHKERPFYKDLVEFMTSGPCVPIILEKENAFDEFRELIGATDPKDAAPGTIRRDFAANKQENIVHGSDSPENAEREIAFFFSDRELLEL